MALVGVLLLAFTRPSNARAKDTPEALPITINWDAPPECPDLNWVEERLRTSLGDELHKLHSTWRVDARVQEIDGSWSLDLKTQSASHEGSRTLNASHCEAVAAAAVEILTLSLLTSEEEFEGFVGTPDPEPGLESEPSDPPNSDSTTKPSSPETTENSSSSGIVGRSRSGTAETKAKAGRLKQKMKRRRGNSEKTDSNSKRRKDQRQTARAEKIEIRKQRRLARRQETQKKARQKKRTRKEAAKKRRDKARPLNWKLGALGGTSLLVFPNIQPGFRLWFAPEWTYFRIAIGFDIWNAGKHEEQNNQQDEPIGGRFLVLAGSLRLCGQKSFRSVTVPLCFGGELGRLRVQPFGTQDSAPDSAMWVGFNAGPQLVWQVTESLGVRFALEALLMAKRPEFYVVDNDTPLLKPNRWGMRTTLGMDFRLP